MNKGLYKFSIYLTITSIFTQRIYFFFRDNIIIKNTLKTDNLLSQIPNNVNINFIIDIKNNNEELEIAIISEKDIDTISSLLACSEILFRALLGHCLIVLYGIILPRPLQKEGINKIYY